MQLIGRSFSGLQFAPGLRQFQSRNPWKFNGRLFHNDPPSFLQSKFPLAQLKSMGFKSEIFKWWIRHLLFLLHPLHHPLLLHLLAWLAITGDPAGSDPDTRFDCLVRIRRRIFPIKFTIASDSPGFSWILQDCPGFSAILDSLENGSGQMILPTDSSIKTQWSLPSPPPSPPPTHKSNHPFNSIKSTSSVALKTQKRKSIIKRQIN